MIKPDYQMSLIRIHPELKSVRIGFTRLMEAGEDKSKKAKYAITNDDRPHKDFVNAIKKLRKFALELLEIDVDAKSIGDWTVTEVHLSGNVVLRQSRAQLRLAKSVERTGKVAELTKTPQVTMYPQNEDAAPYENAEVMSKQIEVVIDEAFAYLNGKYEGDPKGQLPLFSVENIETNFHK